MRAVVTRVTEASVSIEGEVRGQIGQGFLVLLGVAPQDTEAQAKRLADKICALRVFSDEEERMNRNLASVGGEILVVSQFTLFANCKKGNRPSFVKAAGPDVAIPMYERFMELCREHGFHVEHGEFGAIMQVASVNDGPVTIVMDTDEL
ncbi:MAG: D-tyrosyl-tRNA(Tyr) deacylase [Lachnospiraceae bacterium]|nr:D-tyrosyl-tRNA(Tyr) deacylase [Lachnospiraceae bacterium]